MGVPEEILARNPEFYYRCGEVASPPIDETANTTATSVGTTTWGEAGALFGDADTAALLDTSYWTISPDTTLTSYSVILWIKTTHDFSDTVWTKLVGDYGTFPWEDTSLQINSSGCCVSWRVIENDSGMGTTYATLQLAGITPINDGNWHMIAYTYDDVAKLQTLYVDGIDDNPYWTKSVPDTCISPIDINVLRGAETTIDEFAVFSSVLSADDVSDLWNMSQDGSSFIHSSTASTASQAYGPTMSFDQVAEASTASTSAVAYGPETSFTIVAEAGGEWDDNLGADRDLAAQTTEPSSVISVPLPTWTNTDRHRTS